MTADSAGGSGQTLFSFVRHWSRRWNTSPGGPHAQNAKFVLAVETVHALDDGREVTVNDVAAELRLDQSNASRLVAQAVTAGYLDAVRSPSDSRRRVVAVTEAGRQLLVTAHAWQDETFLHLTVDWSDRERLDFTRAMRRLLQRSGEL